MVKNEQMSTSIHNRVASSVHSVQHAVFVAHKLNIRSMHKQKEQVNPSQLTTKTMICRHKTSITLSH